MTIKLTSMLISILCLVQNTYLQHWQEENALDLSHAYNQIMLDDDSRKFLTINTHHGLYCYTTLPFGVALAPPMFQKTMDTILQGTDGVICYLNDILVSGKSKAEHLDNFT